MKKLITSSIGIYLNLLALLSPRRAATKGFYLFCRPLRSPINEKQREFFNTAEKFSIEHNGLIVQGYRWGRGSKKVFFFHGWQSHSYRWKNYVEAFPNDEYTLYAIDAPGHGNSEGNFLSVPLYSELIHKFLISHDHITAVVGHSIGCFSLLYMFHQYPLIDVQKVVLLAPPGEASEFIDVFRNTLKLSNRSVELVIDHFQSVYNVTPDFFSAPVFATSMSAPGLIIHDLTDYEAPHKHAVAISKAWKRSRLLTTNGFGHNLRSPKVVEEVFNFIHHTIEEPMAMHGVRH